MLSCVVQYGVGEFRTVLCRTVGYRPDPSHSVQSPFTPCGISDFAIGTQDERESFWLVLHVTYPVTN